MVFSKDDKILIKNLRQLKGYTATRFLREFKTKNCTRGGLKILLEKIDHTGSVDHVTGSGRPRTARTAGNVTTVSQWRRHLIVWVRAHGAHFEHKFWQFRNKWCVIQTYRGLILLNKPHFSLCVLIKWLESLAQATTQHCVTIWNICVLHGSAVT